MAGVSTQLGTLEKGKKANFLVMSGDLFNKETIIYENWINGKPYYINTRQTTDIRGAYSLKANNSVYGLLVQGTSDKPEFFVVKGSDTLIAKVHYSGYNISLNFEDGNHLYRLSGNVSSRQMHRSGQSIVPMLKSTVQKISLISIPFLLILMLFGPDLFAFFFSEKWRASGEFARILAPWLCLDFVRYGIAQLPLVLGKVRQMMYWSIFGNLMMAGSMCAGALIFDDIRTGLIILSGAMCLYLVLLISWIFKIARNGSHR
jgi:hypothetical protein